MSGSRVQPSRAQTLAGRTLYIPRMDSGGARLLAAAFKSIGIEAVPLPEGDAQTLELGRKYTSGDECYPQQVTLGGFLKVISQPGFRPEKTALLMPTSLGPCRFGQYAPFFKKLLRELGYGDVLVFSPTSANAYEGFWEEAEEMFRTAWRAVVVADILRKLLLKTRPYEVTAGDTDAAYEQALKEVCETFALRLTHRQRLSRLRSQLQGIRDRFRSIPARYDPSRLLIGAVGEIYCRLDDFANDFLIRKLEQQGGEVWLSDIGEWVWYTNDERERNLRTEGKRFSKEMLRQRVSDFIQRWDEHRLYQLFQEDFRGYEEPENIWVIHRAGLPYLPYYGAIGEMSINAGKAVYLYRKGVDGIVDISPFTCMNGIVSEAVYPKISQDHDGIPIRVFYFDGTQADVDRDVAIFMELARAYRRRKKTQRV